MKKIVTIIMILAVVFSLSVNAFAAPVDTGSITVRRVTPGVKLELYKIADYTYDTVSGKYNSVSILAGYKSVFVSVIDDPDITASSTDTDIMLWITKNKPNDSAFAKRLADALSAATAEVTPNQTKTVAAGESSAVFSGLDMGYYLILDKTTAAEAGTDEYSGAVMLKPMNPNVTVTVKSSHYTAPEKSITAGASDGSVKIGDIVGYKIEAVVPGKGTQDFTYVITDTMGDGLALSGNISMTVNGEAVTVGDFASTAGKVTTFTFSEANSKPGDKIIITYNAVVTALASYDNIVNTIDDTITTDRVTVRTYGIDITKVNEAGETLEGVEFILYFNDKNGDEQYMIFENGVFSETTSREDEATVLTTNAQGLIELRGLSAGEYYLKETKALEGYNPLSAPAKIVVDGFTSDKDGNPTDIALAVEDVEIINTTGIVLPGTGGAGRIIFLSFGAIVMLGAAAFLIFNIRRSAKSGK